MNPLDSLLIDEIKAQIARSRNITAVIAVIEDLLKFMKPVVSMEDYDRLLLVSSSMKALEESINMGEIVREEATVEQNILNKRLLYWLNTTYENTRRKSIFSPNFANRVEVMPPPPGITLEKVIKPSGMLHVVWMRLGLAACAPVCRIETPDQIGSGFLLKNGYLMTNYHVLPDKLAAELATVVFNYEEDKDGQVTTKYHYKLDPSTWTGDKKLDFALVKVNKIAKEGKNIAEWGSLELDQRIPQSYEYLTIIQHPNGQPKQMAFDQVSTAQGHFLRYQVNTLTGSSGSPVFDTKWKVIALHHAEVDGQPLNEGVLIGSILDKLPAAVRAEIV